MSILYLVLKKTNYVTISNSTTKGGSMRYRLLKRQNKRINVRKLKDPDYYAEALPSPKVYKIKRTLNRNLRKLRLA